VKTFRDPTPAPQKQTEPKKEEHKSERIVTNPLPPQNVSKTEEPAI